MADSNEDPADSPLVRHVLYTNDVRKLVSGFVGALFTVAAPQRVRTALLDVLENWDMHVERFATMKRAAERIEATGRPRQGPDTQ